MKPEFCKIGPVELSRQEACKLADDNKFIVTSRHIYQVCWSNAMGTAYGLKVWSSKTNMAKPGRFHAMSAHACNQIIGHAFLVDPTQV